VSHRPLAVVSGLTLCDYLLWRWSLNSNHDVLALVSGLTLPPLAVAFVWLLVLTSMRLLVRRTSMRAGRGTGASAARSAGRGRTQAQQAQPPARPASAAERPSSKIAA
jgi:hypothetical protein